MKMPASKADHDACTFAAQTAHAARHRHAPRARCRSAAGRARRRRHGELSLCAQPGRRACARRQARFVNVPGGLIGQVIAQRQFALLWLLDPAAVPWEEIEVVV
ncbi:hypothetical protein [Janthinobacterium sp. JC611]|uniref:hypothetical protein n=1 Tax=Janthinobacterium sp. JC611 TaxID=2816201 RepID=UPI001BFE74E8|nr:hypothetical protein [Janthinobacterium sp. JC611]